MVFNSGIQSNALTMIEPLSIASLIGGFCSLVCTTQLAAPLCTSFYHYKMFFFSSWLHLEIVSRQTPSTEIEGLCPLGFLTETALMLV